MTKIKSQKSIRAVWTVKKTKEEEKRNQLIVRYLKVQSFYRFSQSKTSHPRPVKIVPDLRLCGNWLEQAGFLPEQYVSITVVNDNLLIIQPAPEKEEE